MAFFVQTRREQPKKRIGYLPGIIYDTRYTSKYKGKGAMLAIVVAVLNTEDTQQQAVADGADTSRVL